MWSNTGHNSKSGFPGWATELRHQELLRGLYSQSSEQLNQLVAGLPIDHADTPVIRAIVALAQLRLADNASAQTNDPSSFHYLLEQQISDHGAIRLARFAISAHLRGFGLLLWPLICWATWWLRVYSDKQLLLTLYSRSFSNNTAGLKYALVLFLRALGQRPGPDRDRILGYFGYLCSLNSVMDDGIELMRRAMARLERLPEDSPRDFWLLELRVFFGMAHFYNLNYEAAADEFAALELHPKFRQHLFVSTICYSSWLRLAVLTNKFELAERILAKLQEIFSGDYDKRYALRTHSYRALIAAVHGELETSLSELAIANSIAEPKLDSPETCNTECASHLGVTAKIYMLLGQPDQALEYALRYVQTVERISPYSSFYWEANLLVLKSVLALKLTERLNIWRSAKVNQISREIDNKLREFAVGSRAWSKLFFDLVSALSDLDKLDRGAAVVQIRGLARRYPGVLNDLEQIAGRLHWAQADQRDRRLESAVSQSSQILKANKRLIHFKMRLQEEVLSRLTASRLIELATDFLQTVLPQTNVLDLAALKRLDLEQDAPLAMNAQELAPGILESRNGEDHKLTLTIATADDRPDYCLRIESYQESLNFRRDLLAVMILWREIVESALRDDLMQKREIEHEKSKAIAQTIQMLAHDVRKPFNLLRVGLNMLAEVDQVEKMHATVKMLRPEIDSSLLRVNTIIADVMDMGGNADSLRCENKSLTKMLLDTLRETARIHSKADVQLEFVLEHQHAVAVDAVKVQRVLGNVIDNAVQAMGSDDKLWFHSRRLGEMIELTIGNSGSFIEPDSQALVFDSFYTSKKRGGTGLGLAIAKKLVEAHDGEIRCRSRQTAAHPAGEVEFVLTLPRSEQLDDETVSLPSQLKQILRSAQDDVRRSVDGVRHSEAEPKKLPDQQELRS